MDRREAGRWPRADVGGRGAGGARAVGSVATLSMLLTGWLGHADDGRPRGRERAVPLV